MKGANIKMRKYLLLIGVAVMIVMVTRVDANAITFESLRNNGSLTLVDKELTDWVVDLIDTASIDYSQIEITPITDDPLNPGFRYDFNDELTLLPTQDSQKIWFQPAFILTVTDPNFQVKDLSVEILDFAFTEGATSSVISVFSLIMEYPSLTEITQIQIRPPGSDDANGNATIAMKEQVNFEPISRILVAQEFVIDTEPNVGASLRSVEFRFSQTPVPEPYVTFLI